MYAGYFLNKSCIFFIIFGEIYLNYLENNNNNNNRRQESNENKVLIYKTGIKD